MDKSPIHGVLTLLPTTFLQLIIFCIGGITAYFLLISVYRVTLHPLARYPGPLRYKITDWPLVYQCYKGNRHLYHLRDHERYGSIVRTSPNTLSFSTPTALHQIYGSRAVTVCKSKFYETLDSGSGGSTTHTEIDKEKHAARRRILNHAFSDAALKEAERFVIDNVNKFIRLVGPHDGVSAAAASLQKSNEHSDGDEEGWSAPRNMSDWCNWLAYDIMGNLVFGKSYHCLENEEHRRMPDIMTEGTKFGYWFAYLPLVELLRPFAATPLMQWIGGQTARDNAALIDYAMSQVEERVALENKRRQLKDHSAHKDLMHYLLNKADPKTGLRPTSAELKGDALSLIGAGADTVATSLSATLFYLCRNQVALCGAQAEVRAAFETLEQIRTGPALDSCIYLNACIEEALRISPAVGALLPREVMEGGLVIDGHLIPEGTIVGVPAYVVHHDKDIFPEPWSFKPERWIVGSLHNAEGPSFSKEDVERARDAMCPFSLGSRGCIGKPFAYIEMRIALAALLWSYEIREVEGQEKKGGGGMGREYGRERLDEFQLFDCFGADRDGPVLQFRQRASC